MMEDTSVTITSEKVNWRIRPAIEDDCPSILQLIKDLAVYEKEPESVVEISEKVLKDDCFGKEKWFECLVAEELTAEDSSIVPRQTQMCCCNKLVGIALYFNAYSTWQGRMLFLEDLFVTPQARGQGIGKKFLKELSKVAMQKGCCKIKWHVLHWNTLAMNFYDQIGSEMEVEWRLCCLGKEAMIKLANSY